MTVVVAGPTSWRPKRQEKEGSPPCRFVPRDSFPLEASETGMVDDVAEGRLAEVRAARDREYHFRNC